MILTRFSPRAAVGAAVVLVVLPVSAEPVSPNETASVVVMATRIPQSRFDLPASIDRVDGDRIRDAQWQVNLSEPLAVVPGLVVQNRQNYAQDLQVSSRGFGARSTFGVRGLRLYADGIPATMPDGQGQISHFDLGSAARIEVLRGPFSALYGNSSGGVISVFTEDGKPGNAIDAGVTFGSFGTQRDAVKVSGDNGALNYVVDTASFHTDGYRDHSAVRRNNLNAKFGFSPDEASHLTFVINAVDMPRAQDALGLTRAQFQADPRQAGTNAVAFDTRKSVSQQQAGVVYERRLDGENSVNASLYSGARKTEQYQAILAATQASAAHPGGVIDLGRDYWGTDLHWTRQSTLAGAPLRTTLGVNYENLDEDRKGYQNFVGSVLGVKGALRRNETNRVDNVDEYLQTQWEPTSSWLLAAGVRHSNVQLKSDDHYIVLGNGNDSGEVSYSATTPAIGATWRATESLHVYAAAGKGFETPTLNELSYRSTSGTVTGLNFGLHPAKSEHYEIGIKVRPMRGAEINAALFHIDTKDEIAVQGNASGRAVYQNVGKTQREGFELGYSQRWDSGLGASLAYTRLKAVYDEAFRTCIGLPCVAAVIPSGNSIPGIPRTSLYGEISWRHAPSGFSAALEARAVGKVYVDDANSDAAPAYSVANLRAGFEQLAGEWRFKEFVRVDNIGDRRYAGSVIVNESNRRYFEPAPGRNTAVGISLARAW